MNLVESIIKNGGVTLDMNGKTVQHTSGYYVSIAAIRTLPVNKLTALRIRNDLFLLKALYGNIKNRYLGLWINDGVVYVDVSVNVKRKWYAMGLGKVHGQKAIWDCKNQREWEVK